MLTGIIHIGGALTKIGSVPSIRSKSVVLTGGVYRLVRHPIYSSTLWAFLGLSLITKASVSLFYWPVAFGLYYMMAILEEQRLLVEYEEEYRAYQSRVKGRLIP